MYDVKLIETKTRRKEGFSVKCGIKLFIKAYLFDGKKGISILIDEFHNKSDSLHDLLIQNKPTV